MGDLYSIHMAVSLIYTRYAIISKTLLLDGMIFIIQRAESLTSTSQCSTTSLPSITQDARMQTGRSELEWTRRVAAKKSTPKRIQPRCRYTVLYVCAKRQSDTFLHLATICLASYQCTLGPGHSAIATSRANSERLEIIITIIGNDDVVPKRSQINPVRDALIIDGRLSRACYVALSK